MARPNWVKAALMLVEGTIDPENAMLVAVASYRLAPLPEICFCCLGIAEEALAFHKAQLEQRSCRIIDEHQQATSLCSSFKPVMGRAIDLHQFSQTGPSFAQLMHSCFFSFAWLPQTFLNHEFAHTLIREFELVFFH